MTRFAPSTKPNQTKHMTTTTSELFTNLQLTPSIQLRQHPRVQVLHKVSLQGERVWETQKIETIVDGVITKTETHQFWGNADGKRTRMTTF